MTRFLRLLIAAATDLRFSARALWRAPAFSLTAAATFALCIGPNVAIFSVIYGLILNPLPVADASRLVEIKSVVRDGSSWGSSLVQYLDFKAHADLLSGVALQEIENSTLGDVSPDRIYGKGVTADFFSLLGVEPYLGRFPTFDEGEPGRDHVLVLNYKFWKAHFHADPGIVGETLRLGGEPYVVIGVAPKILNVVGFDYWKPFPRTVQNLDPRRRNTGAVLWARLKPGVPASAAEAQLETIESRSLADQATPTARAFKRSLGYHIELRSPLEQLPDVRRSLLLLQLGAVCVLLVGCVNVANLLLARANAKRAEFAIRFWLGAGWSAILRQLIVEALLLTIAGTALGTALAAGSAQFIARYLTVGIALAPSVALSPGKLGLIMLLAVAAGSAIGLVPFAMLRRNGLRLDRTRSATSSRDRRLASGLLVIIQVAAAVVLSTAAGLLIESLDRVLAVHSGFDAAHTVQGRIAIPTSYSPQNNMLIQQRIAEAMRGIPGVTAASLVKTWPVTNSVNATSFLIQGSERDGSALPRANFLVVGTDFFHAIGIPFVSGRDFLPRDFGSSTPCVIVDETFARRYFPNGDAVGHFVSIGDSLSGGGLSWRRIAGVTARANLAGLDDRDGPPFIYLPMEQKPNDGLNVVVRSNRSVPDILAAMKAALIKVDPALPLYSTGSLQGAIDDMLVRRREVVVLVGLFANLALILAGVGLYGVLAYDVSQRTREIGIRTALGASRGQLLRLVVGQALVRTIAGLTAGIVAALYFEHYLHNVLFDVQPADLSVYAGISMLMLGVAAAASYLPARHATRIDPIVALRGD
ncbi:MAG TPA: ABC transporter permease [Opitutaceae bacterium]|nr:ABC transporter permease [Opitutaceae bacterium]